MIWSKEMSRPRDLAEVVDVSQSHPLAGNRSERFLTCTTVWGARLPKAKNPEVIQVLNQRLPTWINCIGTMSWQSWLKNGPISAFKIMILITRGRPRTSEGLLVKTCILVGPIIINHQPRRSRQPSMLGSMRCQCLTKEMLDGSSMKEFMAITLPWCGPLWDTLDVDLSSTRRVRWFTVCWFATTVSLLSQVDKMGLIWLEGNFMKWAGLHQNVKRKGKAFVPVSERESSASEVVKFGNFYKIKSIKEAILVMNTFLVIVSFVILSSG